MKRIVVTKYENKYIAVFLNDDEPVKIRAFDSLNEYPDKVFTALVKDVKPAINASFVRITEKKTGFLKGCGYKAGSLIPVNVKKETIVKKDDEVTDKISLTGVYSIVTNSFKGLRFSKNLKSSFIETFEKRLYDLGIECDFGIIIRSNASNTSYDSVLNEITVQCNNLRKILDTASHRTYGSVVYEGISGLMEFIISENIDEYGSVVTDIQEVYDHIESYISENKSNSISVNISLKKYDDDYALSALVSLKRIIDYATMKQVYLKSGAHIVIEHTEALTAVDINSGNTLTKGSKDELIHKVNIEAAEEIIKQITLRNLSGIIIADFINERLEENRTELIDEINRLIKANDKTIKCHGMTKLGLIEFSRKREYKPFREQLWK